MDENDVFIGYSGGLVAMCGDKTWGARSPEALIAKLDVEGIARSRLHLIVADDLSCPDHALSARDEAAFVALLGDDVQRA